MCKARQSGHFRNIRAGIPSSRIRSNRLTVSQNCVLDVLNTCDTHNVSTMVFFSLGVPGELREDFEKSLELKKQINEKYSAVKTTAFVIEMEPGAPWYCDPEKFGIQSLRANVKDFIVQQNDPKYSPMSTTGYIKDELFGEKVKSINDLEKKLIRLKCDHFCNQRLMCYAMRSVWTVSNALGLTTLSDKTHLKSELYDKAWRKKIGN